MKAVGQTQVKVTARSVAARGNPKPPCVLVLEKSQNEALFVNSASMLNTDCGVQVNSTGSEALRMNSGSSIHSEQTCVAGGWTAGGASVYNPRPQKCAPFADPLVNLPTPAEATGGCAKSDYRVDGGSATLNPGVYCNRLTVENGAVVTLTPGIYVFRDGQLRINSGATVKGTGVLLFFKGTDARLQMDSLSKIEVSALTSGPYADIVVYQDRHTTTDFFVLNSRGSSNVRGAIYIPNSPLRLNSDSGSTAAPSGFFQIIVKKLELNSLATIVIRNREYESKQTALQERPVRLIQ